MLGSLRRVLVSAFVIALLSTLGDLVWAKWISEHRPLFGLAHGLVLGAAIGLVLGEVRGRAARGALLGSLIVLTAAGAFYALRPFLGYGAMFVVWMAFWLAFGLLSGRWLAPYHTLGESLTRGALAAAGSGVGFHAISGIWTHFDPKTIGDYIYHLACWTIAFAPGFLALMLERRPTGAGTTG